MNTIRNIHSLITTDPITPLYYHKGGVTTTIITNHIKQLPAAVVTNASITMHLPISLKPILEGIASYVMSMSRMPIHDLEISHSTLEPIASICSSYCAIILYDVSIQCILALRAAMPKYIPLISMEELESQLLLKIVERIISTPMIYFYGLYRAISFIPSKVISKAVAESSIIVVTEECIAHPSSSLQQPILYLHPLAYHDSSKRVYMMRTRLSHLSLNICCLEMLTMLSKVQKREPMISMSYNGSVYDVVVSI